MNIKMTSTTSKYKMTGSIFSIILIMSLPGCGVKLYHAIEKGNESQVKQYLETGADINKNKICLNCYMNGETPLEHAARYGNPNMVKLLLENGALPQGDELCFAAAKGNVDVIKVLLDNGDKPNNIHDVSYALLNALRSRKQEAADLLIERGARLPLDAASITLKENISVYSVDGSKDLWNSPYNDSTSRNYYKGSFLFLSPGYHKIVLTLADSGTNSLTSDINVEGGSAYLLESEITKTKRNERDYTSWRPLFTKLK
jgi:ankyrin repeat protein